MGNFEKNCEEVISLTTSLDLNCFCVLYDQSNNVNFAIGREKELVSHIALSMIENPVFKEIIQKAVSLHEEHIKKAPNTSLN